MSQTEVATIQFVKWQPLYEKEKPFQIFLELPPDAQDQRKTNLDFETKRVNVHNIRGRESELTLDQNGFIYRTLEGFDDLNERGEVVDGYLPAIEKFLMEEVEGAHKVSIFDWRMRESNAKDQDGYIDIGNAMLPLRPANFAHSDQGPRSVINRVRNQHLENAEELLKGRIRVLNVWKPLRNKVVDWPLAMCDGAKLRACDLLETDTIRAAYIGTNIYAQHSPET